VGPGAGLDRCGKSRPTGILFVNATFLNPYHTQLILHGTQHGITKPTTDTVIEKIPQVV
jgi:hypothetical protein